MGVLEIHAKSDNIQGKSCNLNLFLRTLPFFADHLQEEKGQNAQKKRFRLPDFALFLIIRTNGLMKPQLLRFPTLAKTPPSETPDLSGMFRRSGLAIPYRKSLAAIPSVSLVLLGHTNCGMKLPHDSQSEIAPV